MYACPGPVWYSLEHVVYLAVVVQHVRARVLHAVCCAM